MLEKLVTASACETLSVLVAAKRVASLEAILARLPDTVPIYAAAQQVIDAIAGFALHRGILAIGRRIAEPRADTVLAGVRDSGDILLLSAIANHDNIGGIFRNAAAFGARAILLDPDCCDPLYRKAIRVSVGATLLVPFARLARDEDPLDLLGRHDFQPLALTPSGSVSLANFTPAPRNAVILGAEGPGLPRALIDRATSLRIQMAGGFDSLNVATTSGIVLHHLATRRASTLDSRR